MPTDFPPILATDAMNSANLFASSAGADSEIEHTTQTYLGAPASRVRQAFDSKSVREEAKKRADAASKRAADEELAVKEGGAGRPAAHSCNTALSCNRETTGHAGRSEMFITGIVAAACVHAVPAMQLAIAMFAAEEHYYYDELLRAAFALRPNLAGIYLDLACKYHHRFRRLLEQLAQEEKISDPGAVQLMLPWMHAFDHDLQCQLKFSGLYTVSAVAAPCAARSEHVLPDLVPAACALHAGGRWPPHRGADGAAVVPDQALLQASAVHDQGALV